MATATIVAVLATLPAVARAAPELPSGFQDEAVLTGLDEPTAVRFSPDGRVFVAEKVGRILLYESLDDESPAVFADLRPQVYDNGDRGLLGLALDPEFPERPYLYALYTFDHVIGEDDPGDYPRWGQPPDFAGDPCPKPPDADVDACPVSGRLVRLTAVGKHSTAEDVLVEDWCQQTSSHSIGDLQFGSEGALFASSGDGASFLSPDYGQFGWPQVNQCDDPPDGIGVALEPPESEGGALRSQDVRTPEDPLTHDDPTSLDGTVIRIDPETGEGLPGNPMAGSTDPNARRIIAYGFRNPFRFAINLESDEVYVGNVGNGTVEEVDRFSTTPSQPYNSGWPCYEGSAPNPGFQDLDLALCESLYDAPGSSSSPFFSYIHDQPVISGDPCPSFYGSAISGSAFYDGSDFPDSYDGALFFSDPVRACMYVMFADEDGRPDPSTAVPFLTGGGLYPAVDIEVGPEGSLYYVSLYGAEFGPGVIHRIAYFSGNRPPVAQLDATPRWGPSPLSVQLDASASSDADGEPLGYEWDPQNDGTYEAPVANGKKSLTFNGSSNRTVAVRVTDEEGASRVARATVYPGDTPPQPVILEPEESTPGSGEADLLWSVGELIEFEGLAHDAEDGDLAKTQLDWNWRLYHCPSACHAHPRQAFPGVEGDTFVAPDHDYPAHLELTLTAVDARGLSASKTIELYPRTVELEIASQPAGLVLGAGLLTKPTPFALTAIEGSSITLTAPQTTTLGGASYDWSGWSDGGQRVHTIVATHSAEYTATYLGLSGSGEGSLSAAAPSAQLKARLLRGPRKRTPRSSARFAFDATATASGFRCELDGGPFVPCHSPRVYRHLRPGRHVFRLMAEAPGGASVSAPLAYRWKVLPKTRGQQ